MLDSFQNLENDLCINELPDYERIDFSIRDLIDRVKVTLKGYKTVIVPYYKAKWHDFRKHRLLRYPVTSIMGGAGLIFSSVAALVDPRPITFVYIGALVACGYLTDVLVLGAPIDYSEYNLEE